MVRTMALLMVAASACAACRSAGTADPPGAAQLLDVPSVTLDPSGTDPGSPAVFIDGVQVDNRILTGAMGCLDPDDIERIEIAIGPDDPAPGEIRVSMKVGRAYDPEAPC